MEASKPIMIAPAVPGGTTVAAASSTRRLAASPKTKLIVGGLALVVAVLAVLGWIALQPSGPGAGFTSGNGRIEATEIDIATKLGGRVINIAVDEGDFVEVGQPLAQMQIDVLDAQRDEARAQSQQAVNAVASAEAEVVARQSEKSATAAMVEQRTSELDVAQRHLARTETLTRQGALAVQDLDDDRARVHSAEAVLTGAQAQVAVAEAGIKAAQAQAIGANSSVAATVATIARVEADILDSTLKSPRAGRVQYRIAQPGEVVGAGGKILSLVDLGDVYMTFFLPETVVGKVAIGSEVHLVLDAALQYVIPAKVSYVASTAQFTPKSVETASERQKLMFRVRAQIDRALLVKHLKLVKTGLPGVAWLKLDAQAKWPANLEIKLPE